MKIINEIEVGQTISGRVTSIKDFGVFVDLGGVEGLVHISELSWSRVNNPADIVSEGEDVNVFILGVDKENKKISLGMKQLEPDPWVEIANRYKVGDIIEGEISRLATFGAFIKIEENIEGLIHISEISHDRIAKVDDVLKEGQQVKAKIIKLHLEEQKIGLSIKSVDSTASAEIHSEASEDASASTEIEDTPEAKIESKVENEIEAVEIATTNEPEEAAADSAETESTENEVVSESSDDSNK